MEKKLTFLEHLEELRKRIIVTLIFFILSSGVCFFFSPYILKILKRPAGLLIEKLFYFNPLDPILIYMRIAIIGGIAISMPLILYQIWAFVSPALDQHFKKCSWQFVFFSFLMFILGISFGYFLVLPYILRFLLSLGVSVLQPLISASGYVFFTTSIIFFCGIIFQLPLVLIVLGKVGLINHKFLKEKRKWIVLFIFIVIAIITPTTDIFSLLIFSLPLLILYEISIWLTFFIK